MYKEDFLAIGGHDELFAPQSKEDSDLFNRFQLAGYKFKQPWDALVYHFTSRGSRFNKHAGGATGKNSEEWLYTTTKNMRNFIRKWGTVVQHDQLMKPVISPKYDIGFIVKNSNSNLLAGLEPWCSTLYIDSSLIKSYVETEKSNTTIDLYDRIKPYDNEKQNQILIEIDGSNFDEQDYQNIQQLPPIIYDSGELGEFELGNLKISIFNLKNSNTFLEFGYYHRTELLHLMIIKQLLKKGHKIVSVDNYSTGKKENHIKHKDVQYLDMDILDIDCNDFGFKPALIYHLAAKARIQPSFEQPEEYIRVNYEGTYNIIKLCLKEGISMIYAGSSSHHSGKFSNPYTFSKDMGEEIIQLYRKHFGLRASIVRFYNVYGPYQLTEGGYTTLIGRWLNNIKNNIPCEIFGDGEKRRDFTHVDDIVRGLVRRLNHQYFDDFEFF